MQKWNNNHVFGQLLSLDGRNTRQDIWGLEIHTGWFSSKVEQIQQKQAN